MFTVALLALLAAFAGDAISLFMLLVAIRRKERVVRTAPNDYVAHITVSRTIRNEITFLITQVLLTVTSAINMSSVNDVPESFKLRFVISCVARMLVSGAMVSCSLADILDRRRIHDVLNEAHAKQMLEEAIKLGLDVTDIDHKKC
jgi:hypothetical protein